MEANFKKQEDMEAEEVVEVTLEEVRNDLKRAAREYGRGGCNKALQIWAAARLMATTAADSGLRVQQLTQEEKQCFIERTRAFLRESSELSKELRRGWWNDLHHREGDFGEIDAEVCWMRDPLPDLRSQILARNKGYNVTKEDEARVSKLATLFEEEDGWKLEEKNTEEPLKGEFSRLARENKEKEMDALKSRYGEKCQEVETLTKNMRELEKRLGELERSLETSGASLAKKKGETGRRVAMVTRATNTPPIPTEAKGAGGLGPPSTPSLPARKREVGGRMAPPPTPSNAASDKGDARGQGPLSTSPKTAPLDPATRTAIERLIEGKMRSLQTALLKEIRGGAGAGRKLPATAPSKSAARTEPVPTPKGGGPGSARKEASTEDSSWARVVGRKEKRAVKKQPKDNPPAPPVEGARGGAKRAVPPERGTGEKGRKPPRIRPPPPTAAIALTREGGSGSVSYAEALSLCRNKISLKEVGVSGMRLKLSQTGGRILEIPGEDRDARADALASRIRDALAGKGVRVGRPTKFAEMRIGGVDDSVTRVEVAAAIAAEGGCPEGEVRVGEMRTDPSGLRTAWVRCPASAAKKIADAGELQVGWVRTVVTPLRARPMRCYRCLEVGHSRALCASTVDRGNRCYRCGRSGHGAGACQAEALQCPLCEDLGRPAGHRLGGDGCTTSPSSGARRKGRFQESTGRKRAVDSGDAEARGGGGKRPPPPMASKGGGGSGEGGQSSPRASTSADGGDEMDLE